MKAIYLLLLTVLGLLLANCKHNTVHQQKIAEHILTKQDSIIKDSVWKDSLWNALLKHIDEPEIKTATIETYRFILINWFSPSYVFRIQEDSVGTYSLISKAILFKEGACHSYMYKSFSLLNDTAIQTIKQQITGKEWAYFAHTLWGSYYWALDSRTINQIHGGTDYSTMIFETKSFLPSTQELTYKKLNLAPILRGSFTESYDVLLEKSKMTNKYSKDLEEINGF